jgi:hypothetical protein
MFGKHHTLAQLFSGIAVVAAIAAIAVSSAAAGTSSRSFITDTLGGNGSAKALPDVVDRYIASHTARPVQAPGMTFITDTLGGNGHPAQPTGSYPDYVNGGMSAVVAQSNQVTAPSAGNGFSWGYTGLAAGLAACLLVLLFCGTRFRTHKRGILAA